MINSDCYFCLNENPQNSLKSTKNYLVCGQCILKYFNMRDKLNNRIKPVLKPKIKPKPNINAIVFYDYENTTIKY